MSTTTSGDNLVNDDDFVENDTWNNEHAESNSGEKSAAARHKPKWRNIEQYWEERRLREQLKDFLRDED